MGTLIVYVVGGDRSRAMLEAGRLWVVANADALAFTVTLLFGILFTGQGIRGLVIS